MLYVHFKENLSPVYYQIRNKGSPRSKHSKKCKDSEIGFHHSDCSKYLGIFSLSHPINGYEVSQSYPLFSASNVWKI